MRTTVWLEEALLEQAKRESAQRGETLTSLIEMGLRLVLAQSRPHRRAPKVVLPVTLLVADLSLDEHILRRPCRKELRSLALGASWDARGKPSSPSGRGGCRG